MIDFGVGISLVASARGTVRNVTASDNTVGIDIGPNRLVKDCTVQRNRFEDFDFGSPSAQIAPSPTTS